MKINNARININNTKLKEVYEKKIICMNERVFIRSWKSR